MVDVRKDWTSKTRQINIEMKLSPIGNQRMRMVRNSELQSILASRSKERSGPIPSSPPASLWCSLNARTHSFYAPSTLFTRVQLFICGSNVMFGAQVESRGSSGLIPTRCRQSALQNRTRTDRYTYIASDMTPRHK